MNYKVISISKFEKELKWLVKKYPSLKAEYMNLVHLLKAKPVQGTPIGNNCYKIIVAIASKGKGKSGGARIITCLQVVQTSVYLLTIYDKSQRDNITDKELLESLKRIPE